jgi:hypothetical protein
MINQYPLEKESHIGSSYSLTHSFVSVISQIISIVEGLAMEIEEL